ncbi:MAG: BamA/TamA family outer membrane protein [Verrucomicrobia bacterium]|nr:BamA/TamA family outer membrane protein [Verrucomicrobiota bacterium]
MRRAVFYTFAFIPTFLCALAYEVNFVGLDDKDALKALKDVSDLVKLQDRPPASINALRYRIASDLPNLLKGLRAYAYYDATIATRVENRGKAVQVYLYIYPGPQYKLGPYEIYHGVGCIDLAGELPRCGVISGEQLGLTEGKAALSVGIVNAELSLLNKLAHCGYPLAYIDKRKVEVDMASKTVNASVCIQEGPLSKFGPSTLFGLKDVHPRYIERRFAWKEGEIYDSAKVEETQRRILKSDLFSSVLVSHAEGVDSEGELPMKIRLTEAKHRSISASVFYATVDGPGASAGWTHRNIRGMGEIFSAYGEWSLRYWIGSAAYTKPDFLRLDQTLKFWGDISRENIYPYLAFTYREAQRIERKINPKTTASVGLKFEYIDVSESASDGHYALLGIPIYARYDTTDNPLNPTKNYSITYQLTPYQSVLHGHEHFLKQRLTGCVYFPLTESKWVILALRAQFGSIVGAKRENVPLPKLFLGGSLDDLRGYKYKTVSPLKKNHPHRNRPLGGRGAIFATVETRFRVTESFGIVPFFDIGTVTESEYPQVEAPWFKSVGLGLRYFAFFGPVRFDIARAINRRKKYGHKNSYLDPPVNFYASVGQTF